MTRPASARTRATGGRRALVRLPLSLADFEKRGFRLDRPHERAVLEQHATSFLTGFNLAAAHQRDVHTALSGVDERERGFAYEGAAMYAAFRDLMALRGAPALHRLLSGPGSGYVHLIHVGYGWAGAMTRVPRLATVPATPLLRWLALDGAGFARVYFGGLPTLRKVWNGTPTDRWHATAAGFGRALWFVESADVTGVAAVIEEAPPPAKGPLWSGIGLASCYAGGASPADLDALVAASGAHAAHFGQGALFAIAARARAGVLPPHTERACARLFTVEPREAAEWTDVAARGLCGSAEVGAYSEWKSRLRAVAVARF